MEEELEEWLNKTIETYPEITKERMSELINHNISSSLYSSIPSNSMNNSHQEKVDYMMNMLEKLQQPKEKAKLNLVIADGSSSMEYIQYLSTDFEVTVIDFKDVKNRKDVDLVLFTGGEDVNPELYGEAKGQFTYINKGRDKKEREVFNFFKGYVSMLGVCRGNQLLCVLNGGRLIQHVEGHDRDHTIMIKGYTSPIPITSTHHQMVYPFNLKEENYELVGYSEFYKSKTYLNGDNREINLPKEFLEPEIVFYPKTKCLGIQGHPEYGSCPSNTKKICMKLIKKYLLNKDSKKEESESWYDGFDDNYYHEDEYIPVNEEIPQYKGFSDKVKTVKSSISGESIRGNVFDINNLSSFTEYSGKIKTPDESFKEADIKSYYKSIGDEFNKELTKAIKNGDFLEDNKSN